MSGRFWPFGLAGARGPPTHTFMSLNLARAAPSALFLTVGHRGGGFGSPHQGPPLKRPVCPSWRGLCLATAALIFLLGRTSSCSKNGCEVEVQVWPKVLSRPRAGSSLNFLACGWGNQGPRREGDLPRATLPTSTAFGRMGYGVARSQRKQGAHPLLTLPGSVPRSRCFSPFQASAPSAGKQGQ